MERAYRCIAHRRGMECAAHRIPNWLTGAVFLSGVVWAATQGVAAVADGFAGSRCAGLPFVLLFLFAGGGAADVQSLMGAWACGSAQMELLCFCLSATWGRFSASATA